MRTYIAWSDCDGVLISPFVGVVTLCAEPCLFVLKQAWRRSCAQRQVPEHEMVTRLKAALVCIERQDVCAVLRA